MVFGMPVVRVLIVWVHMAFAMTANGIVRELALKRAFWSTAGDVVSAILGAAIILAITRRGFRPLAVETRAQLAAVSVVLVVLTVGFEIVMGRYAVAAERSTDLATRGAR